MPEVLDLLRPPEEVMAATWDLSAGKKDGIHIGMWYGVAAPESKLRMWGQIVAPGSFHSKPISCVRDDKFRGLSGTVVYKQHGQDNSSLTSSTKHRPPKWSWGALHIHMLHTLMTCLWAHYTYSLLSCNMNTTSGGGSVSPADIRPESAISLVN